MVVNTASIPTISRSPVLAVKALTIFYQEQVDARDSIIDNLKRQLEQAGTIIARQRGEITNLTTRLSVIEDHDPASEETFGDDEAIEDAIAARLLNKQDTDHDELSPESG